MFVQETEKDLSAVQFVANSEQRIISIWFPSVAERFIFCKPLNACFVQDITMKQTPGQHHRIYTTACTQQQKYTLLATMCSCQNFN